MDPRFKVVDVHARQPIIANLGHARLSFRTDAIITPFDQADLHAHRQACIIVDFSSETACPAVEDVDGRCLAALAAASSISLHDVMVAITDLNHRSHIWRAEGGTLMLWQDCDIRQTVFIMAQFLNDMCAPMSVARVDSDDVPGLPASKRARQAWMDRIHGLVSSNQLLLGQLEAFRGEGDNGWIAARELVFISLVLPG